MILIRADAVCSVWCPCTGTQMCWALMIKEDRAAYRAPDKYTLIVNDILCFSPAACN